MRDGKEFLIPNTDIVVGDLLKLETGDKIAADGLCVESHNLVVDEALLTGESDPLKKGLEDPFVRAGTQVESACGAGVTRPAVAGSEGRGQRTPLSGQVVVSRRLMQMSRGIRMFEGEAREPLCHWALCLLDPVERE